MVRERGTACSRVQPVAFLDEDELEPAERPSGRRQGRRGQSPYVVRRLIALGAAVLVVVLALFGVRGCLDARKERAFENYLRDLSSIAGDSRQLSNGFFERLQSPPEDLTDVDLQNAIRSDRGSAEGHLQRVQGMDVPDQLSDAQSELVLAFELRRDALETIAEQVPAAVGAGGQHERALTAISRQMRVLVASDALYQRARSEIDRVLSEEEIEGEAPGSQFVPGDGIVTYLDELALSALLASVAVSPDEADQVRGVELLGTTVEPAGVILLPDSANTVSLDGRLQLEIDVQNSGEVREPDVRVSFSISGGPEQIEGRTTIEAISPAGSETATLAIRPRPPTGTELSLTVTVAPVPGETLVDNNRSTYPITFD